MQQQSSICDFKSSDSWVILSPIELSIKRKIESVGIPLKDWDIKINYGIKTGFNDAFIISTAKRNEILENCKDADERKRTAELIRPILRGRDIKRYGYEYADLYLIATFPSRHYDIEQYPAVKNYLLSFGIERLEQTGMEHIVNGKKVKARKKTNNKWFEVQDSISYWEDFSKPKVMYSETNDYYNTKIAFDIKGFLTDKTCFFVVGERIEWIYFFMCSKIFTHFMQNTSPGLGSSGISLTGITVEKFPVPQFSSKQAEVFTTLLQQNDFASINSEVYELYGLSQNEIEIIENQ